MKHLGLFSFITTWVGIFFLLRKNKLGAGSSISRHAAANKLSYAIMALLETLVLCAFTAFIILWFVPYFKLGAMFTALMITGAVGVLIAAWIPDTKGRSHVIHEFAAYGSHLLFIPALALLIDASIPFMARIVAILSFIFMVSAVLIFTLFPTAKKQHLYVQVIYMMLFHLTILCVTYG